MGGRDGGFWFALRLGMITMSTGRDMGRCNRGCCNGMDDEYIFYRSTGHWAFTMEMEIGIMGIWS